MAGISLARKAYDFVNLDRVDQKSATLLGREVELTLTHLEAFALPYRSFSALGYQTASIFLHAAKLAKNIVFLFGTLLLASAALLSDWKVAHTLGMMAAGRAISIVCNLTSTLLAIASVLVNTVAIPVNKIANRELNEDGIQDLQRSLIEKVKHGFFDAAEPTPYGNDFLTNDSYINRFGR